MPPSEQESYLRLKQGRERSNGDAGCERSPPAVVRIRVASHVRNLPPS